MWESDFQLMLKNNPETETSTSNILNKVPLSTRDALYGGRTGNTTEHYKAKDSETIKYVNVCSLFPWVCKYGRFPKGHPKKIICGYRVY